MVTIGTEFGSALLGEMPATGNARPRANQLTEAAGVGHDAPPGSLCLPGGAAAGVGPTVNLTVARQPAAREKL
jgi:hypothetical protein